MINTVDNKIRIIYPLNIKEDGIQEIINEVNKLLNNDRTNFKSIQLETDDIALSLVFLFKDLMTREDLNIELIVTPKVYNMLTSNFSEIFNNPKLKVSNEQK